MVWPTLGSRTTKEQNRYFIHHHEEARELPGERDNARNNVSLARCTQARKTMHGLDGQHQDIDRTPCGRVNHYDGGQR